MIVLLRSSDSRGENHFFSFFSPTKYQVNLVCSACVRKAKPPHLLHCLLSYMSPSGALRVSRRLAHSPLGWIQRLQQIVSTPSRCRPDCATADFAVSPSSSTHTPPLVASRPRQQRQAVRLWVISLVMWCDASSVSSNYFCFACA